MTAFEFENYKDFFRAWLKAQPKKGHGQLLKIASFLGVHTTLLTHIFRGDSDPTVEQSLKLCSYMGLSETEKDYFVAMVQRERAANEETKKYFEAQRLKILKNATTIKNQIKTNFQFDELSQGKFFSEWTFAAVHLLLALPSMRNASTLAEHLNLPLPRVNEIIRFLLETGLAEKKNGELIIGPTQTFADRNSPFFKLHLKNWRQKAVEQIHSLAPEETCFTHVGALSEKDFKKIQLKIVEWIKEFREISDPSPSETIACLNIDCFKVRA